MLETLLGALFIFAMRVGDVSLGTIRIIVSVQGRKYLAAAIGFVEVTIFVVAISRVLSQMVNPINVLAYSGGFATGTILGISIEAKLAMGYRMVRVITHRTHEHLENALREAGFGVTRLLGEGKDGRVFILISVVRRKNLNQYLAVVNELAPKAFVTVEESREAKRGYFPSGLVTRFK